jgi:cyanophycin synthetase
VIIKEDGDLRGRAPGEVADILLAGPREAGLPEDKITLVLDELEAADTALDRAHTGDLVVIFADDVDAVWKRVAGWNRTGDPLQE